MNRWPDYNAGTLTLPAIVQHDTMPTGEHLVWVAVAQGVIAGPYSRTSYDEASVIVDAVASAAPPAPEYAVECEDGTVVNA